MIKLELVGAIVKASDQLKSLKRSFAGGPHTFMKLLAKGLQEELREVAPGIQTKLGNKSTTDTTISMKVTGIAPAGDDTSERVRQLMDRLKNPVELLKLIK